MYPIKKALWKLAAFLHKKGIEIISTGGTMKAIKAAGIPVTYVSDVTGTPEMMDGRVKTLNPKIHGGILAIRSNPQHMQDMKDNGIRPIDLVVCNLYPFEQTIAKTWRNGSGSHREHRHRRPCHGAGFCQELPRCGDHHQSGPL